MSIVVEVERAVGWPQLWDLALDHGPKCVNGLRNLVRVFHSHPMPYPPVLYARTRISPETHSYLMCSTRTQEAVSAAANYYLHYYLLLTQTLLCFNIYVLWLIFSDIFSVHCTPCMPPGPIIMNFDLKQRTPSLLLYIAVKTCL